MATTKTTKKKRKPGEPSPAQLRARRKFAAMAKARAKAARAAKRAAGIKTPAKKRASATKPPKKRNVLTPDRNHPVEVTRHWRKGGASAWQRAEAAGQRRLFTMNGKKANGSGIAKAKKQRQEFLGSPARKVTNTTVPKGAKPKGALSKMGRLMRVKVKGRSWMDFQGVPTLARDAKNKMFVTGTA
jgi:hypothetical protein